MPSTTTVVLLRFLADGADDSTRQGRSKAWQDMLVLISRAPGWHYTNVGKGFSNDIVVCLIVGKIATLQTKFRLADSPRLARCRPFRGVSL